MIIIVHSLGNEIKVKDIQENQQIKQVYTCLLNLKQGDNIQTIF